MNISFHYFTVKTLCYYADLTEARAQNIAFYSQLVDDFNLSWLNFDSGFYVDEKPPAFFLNNKLALDTGGNTWFIYPVTTGISILQSAASLMNKKHQRLTLIPFHFIPYAPIANMGKDETLYCCRQAEPKDGSIISNKLEKFLEEKITNDMNLGVLLHIYADTYAHQRFSGRWGVENDAILAKAYDISGIKEKDVTNIASRYRALPGVGHAKLDHTPDTFALSFSAQFKVSKEAYYRKNIDTFLLCAKRILAMLMQYNHQTPIDERYFDNEIAPRITRAGYACVKGAEEIDEFYKLAAIWKGEFPKCTYDYKYSSSWECEKSPRYSPIYTYYHPSKIFYAYNEYAYRHLNEVSGIYRMEEEE